MPTTRKSGFGSAALVCATIGASCGLVACEAFTLGDTKLAPRTAKGGNVARPKPIAPVVTPAGMLREQQKARPQESVPTGAGLSQFE